MAAAAHNPQARERFLKGTGWQRIKSEYQPPAGHEGAVDLLECLIRSLGRDEGPGKPRQGEGCVLLEVLHALRAKLDPFSNSALCQILARKRQSRLPWVNTNHTQRRSGACGFDGQPADASADVEKHAGPLQHRAQVWSLCRHGVNPTDDEAGHLSL